MTQEEFLKAFLPDYETKMIQFSKEYCNTQTGVSVQGIICAFNNHYFPEALAHCLRRQREICAETYWRETEDEHIDWSVYTKIKQAHEPQNYGL
ncbi:MAG: hypothetical protein LBC68_07705 [Prevotellaceae bacterium]|jgi:hypothetical protein|nr:hypothetical protein [Prevotellaceae bacterium]